MDRLFVISLTFCLLTACTSIPISEPLKQTKAASTLVQWQASEPVTYFPIDCQHFSSFVHKT